MTTGDLLRTPCARLDYSLLDELEDELQLALKSVQAKRNLHLPGITTDASAQFLADLKQQMKEALQSVRGHTTEEWRREVGE